jgi:HEXXH motif-containing protein
VLELFQEGGDFVADLEGPGPEDYVPLAAAISEVRGLLRAIDPPLVELIDQLLPLVILALPGPRARNEGRVFGGATTFFFRGGTLVNARADHTLATLLEVIVHEYAHAELFALAQDGHLCTNAENERHPVRIRSDPRPMNGILHALHVSSRVGAVFERVLRRGLPWRSDRDPLLADIASLRQEALSNGRSCLEAVLRHGRLTPLGRTITAAAALRLGEPVDAAAVVAGPA